MSFAAKARLGAGGALLALFVLPLYAPPATVPTPLVLDDYGLIERLFPGVPAWWSAGRLLCLFAGAALIASVIVGRSDSPRHMKEGGRGQFETDLRFGPPLAIAAFLACLALASPYLNPFLQTVFVLGLFVPASTLWAAKPHVGSSEPRSPAILVLLATWVTLRWQQGAFDVRAATPVDTWENLARLIEAWTHDTNLLVGRFEPGVSDLLHFLMGVPLLWAMDDPVTYRWAQGVNVAWLLVAALGLHAVTRRLLDEASALVATAVFLFSPATLFMAMTAVPMAVLVALSALMLAAYVYWWDTRHPAGLLLLAALVGLSLGFGHTAILAAGIGGLTAVSLALRRDASAALLTTAALVGFAAAWPVIPDASALQAMSSKYLQRYVPWGYAEGWLLGWPSPLAYPTARDVIGDEARGAFDIALGTILSPFATPRTPLRLWGDTFIEPIGAALGAVGIVACKFSFRQPRSALLLALIALAILPGFTSSYDRASLIRLPAVPLLTAVFAGLAYTAILGTNRRRAFVAAALISSSGVFLFDGVNPTILRSSWMTVAMESSGTAPPRRIVFVEPGRPAIVDWLHVRTVANHLPSEAMKTFAYAGSFDGIEEDTEVFWSMGIEERELLTSAYCAHRPGGRVWRLDDATGRPAVYMGSDSSWQPSIHPTRVRHIRDCR